MGLDKIKCHSVKSPLTDTTDYDVILLSIDKTLQSSS